jgi:kynurenine formamidase
MRFRTFAIGYCVALALFVLAQREPSSVEHVGFNRAIDLTRAVDISLESATYARLRQPEGLLARQSDTRIEAPAKLVPGMWTVNQIPAARLRAPLVVMNVEHSVAADPNYKISVEDIARWEQRHGQIPFGAVVVARTGWQPREASRKTTKTTRVAQPGFTEDATRLLVEGRVVLGLGSDQPAQIVPRVAHTYTSRHSVYQLTNVANLNSVPESGSLLLISPEMAPGSVENRAHLTAMTE